jgi:hypothetical protein
MTKKTMLLALATVSAAMFAMPAVASANWGVDPVNQTFTGTSEVGTVGFLSAAGEPTITCEGPDHGSGAWTNGTEGTFTMHLTKCHHVVLGFTIECKTAGAPLNNTVHVPGTFKNVTVTVGGVAGKRGITMTPNVTTVQCGATKPMTITGTIIGLITDVPEGCDVTDSEATLEFLISGGKQAPMRTDGSVIDDDLFLQTEGGSKVTAALESKSIIKTPTPTTFTCNAP